MEEMINDLEPADKPGVFSVQPDMPENCNCPGCGKPMKEFHLCGADIWVFYLGKWAVLSIEELEVK